MLLVNKLWHKEGEASAEVETGRLLAALIMVQKPHVVVETGCNYGATSIQLAEAVRYNGHGRLHTCDIEEDCTRATLKRLRDLPASVYRMRGIDLLASIGSPIDFLFIDSGCPAAIRVEEAEWVAHHRDRFSPNAIIALHDTCQNYGAVHDRLLELTKWRHLVMQTPYGLSIFQKDDPDFSYRGRMVDLEDAPN